MRTNIAIIVLSLTNLAGCANLNNVPASNSTIPASLPGYPKDLGFVRIPSGSVCKMIEPAFHQYHYDCVPDPSAFLQLGSSLQAATQTVPDAPALPAHSVIQVNQDTSSELSAHTLELLNELQVQQDDNSTISENRIYHHSRTRLTPKKNIQSTTPENAVETSDIPLSQGKLSTPAAPKVVVQQPIVTSEPAYQPVLRTLNQNGPSY
jgi:hypothetical protein